MNARICLLCERPTPTEQLYVFGDHSLQRCRGCGLEFLHPQPPPAELIALYNEHYFASPDSARRGYDRYEADEASLRKTFRRRWRMLARWLPASAPGRVLDVGCALGYFLAVAAEDGWDAHGVEISAWAAGEARRRHGLDVRPGTLETVEFPPATFNLITMWDVLEHLPHPNETLRRCHSLLKANGRLTFTTPNAQGLLRKLTGRRWVEYQKIPEHLYFFSPATIRPLLEKAHFRPLSIRSEGKYVGLGFLLVRLAEANPLLSPLRWPARLPSLGRVSLYVNATNTMLVVAQKT